MIPRNPENERPKGSRCPHIPGPEPGRGPTNQEAQPLVPQMRKPRPREGCVLPQVMKEGVSEPGEQPAGRTPSPPPNPRLTRPVWETPQLHSLRTCSQRSQDPWEKLPAGQHLLALETSASLAAPGKWGGWDHGRFQLSPPWTGIKQPVLQGRGDSKEWNEHDQAGQLWFC